MRYGITYDEHYIPAPGEHVEQEITRRAVETTEFDYMTDEEWCCYLERRASGGRDHRSTKALIRDLVLQGLTNEQIRRRVRVNKDLIRETIQDMGIRGRRAILKPEEEASIVNRYQAGMSISELASKTHRGWKTIRAVLKRNGIHIRDVATQQRRSRSRRRRPWQIVGRDI